MSPSNQITRLVQMGFTSGPFSSVEIDYNSQNQATGYVFNFQSTAPAYSSYQVATDASGNALQETLDLSSGWNELIALTGGQTLTGSGDDIFAGSASGATTFALNGNFGVDTIVNLTNADNVSLSQSEFADFSALQGAATNVGANVVISAADGDTLTLLNMTTTALAGMGGNFTFHA
jgi:hypothetical protein